MKTIRQAVNAFLILAVVIEVFRYTAFDAGTPGFAVASARNVMNIVLLAALAAVLQLFKGKSHG